MSGLGLVRGLFVTIGHFIETYMEDFRYGKKRYRTKEGIQRRSSSQATGAFTIQYPEEKLEPPEEFRYIPFLVYETGEAGEKNYRCTSCGICAKVCPPQCIWIVRKSDPVTGKPVPVPAEFYIDVDICMNCGLCAEYCPFDAIKMDHDYELVSQDRLKDHIYDMDKLGKAVSYYAQIRPANYEKEETIRKAKKPAVA
jgi:NADH-quinone oxidoreductase subunit I